MEGLKLKTLSASLPVPEPLQALLTALNRTGVVWCSWKSNEHLAEGISGKTDIDVLFNAADRRRVIKIFYDCGFMVFETARHRAYPGILDAISVNNAMGAVFHIHAHFLLCLGEKNLKSVILPWSDHILQNRVSAEDFPQAYVSAPADEMILLLVREALKVRARDRAFAKRDGAWGGKGFTREFNWLKERAVPAEIRDAAEKLMNAGAAAVIHEMVTQGVTLDRLERLRKETTGLALQSGWRRIGGVPAVMQAWLREGIMLFARVLEKAGAGRTLIVQKRVLPGKGIVAALLGPDGSGKSSVARETVARWSRKIDVCQAYFGTGDGQQPFLQWVLKKLLAAGLLVREKLGKKKNCETVPAGGAGRLPRSLPVYAIIGALHKRRQARRIEKLRRRGFVVICDRWPQNQFAGINDGPFLRSAKDGKNGFLRFLARWEERQFENICAGPQPDIVIRMIPSLEVAIARKKENIDMAASIKEKLSALRAQSFDPGIEDHVIDADRPFETVLAEAGDIIWKSLLHRPAKKPALYECVGLSGAGKTTACREMFVRKNTLASVDDVFTPEKPLGVMRKISLTLQSLMRDPGAYFYAVNIVFGLRLWRHAGSLGHLFRLPAQRLRLKNAAADGGAYLIEQLLLQNLWSALVTADVRRFAPDALAPFIEALYRDIDVRILYFDAEAGEAARRVTERKDGASRFDHLPPGEAEEGLKKYGALMNDIVRAARYAGLDVVAIDASRPRDKVAADLESALEEC
ncbi:MAG: hypothetical protein HY370_08470 [Proteobacteria bacterium]|nr:hypothetical protein [Pseudomonadota bacterium]